MERYPTGCSFDCGGNCALQVYVEDGCIRRIGPDESPDEVLRPQLRPCARGLAQGYRVHAPDRLLYPMKRIGERGEGRFRRVSWDEALDTVAEEMRRIKNTYGPQAIFNLCGSGNTDARLHHTIAVPTRLMHMLGGCTSGSAVTSFQSVIVACRRTFGVPAPIHDRETWPQSKLIIMWGCNPAFTLKGTNTNWYLARAREAGVRFVFVDPVYTESAAALADQWIPILPGTDTAMLVAMACVIVSEGLHDRAFIDRLVYGFERWCDYLFGGEDGVPKTPDWAAPITGVPAATIAALAREYATAKPADLRAGWAPGRTAFGEQFHRAAIGLAALTGNVGRVGGSPGVWMPDNFAGAEAFGMGTVPVGTNPVRAYVPYFHWADAVLRGKAGGYPSDIKMAYIVGTNIMNQNGDVNKGVRALKSLESVVVQEQFMTPTACFADVLLPVTTHFERTDVQVPHECGYYLIHSPKVLEPPGECKSDLEICTELAKRLGLEGYNDKSESEWLEEMAAGSPAGGYRRLAEQGVYKWAPERPRITFQENVEDPEGHPFPTETGKIELFSPQLARRGDPLFPPLPKYLDRGEREGFPLLLVTSHARMRVNSTFANVPLLAQYEPSELLLNPLDARRRGISDGDRVRVYSAVGALLTTARVVERVMPGVVHMYQGAWFRPAADGADEGACVNSVCPDTVSPGASGATNGALVQVERA